MNSKEEVMTGTAADVLAKHRDTIAKFSQAVEEAGGHSTISCILVTDPDMDANAIDALQRCKIAVFRSGSQIGKVLGIIAALKSAQDSADLPGQIKEVLSESEDALRDLLADHGIRIAAKAGLVEETPTIN